MGSPKEDIGSMTPGELVRIISMTVFSRESELAALGGNGRSTQADEEAKRERVQDKYQPTLELLEGELNRKVRYLP